MRLSVPIYQLKRRAKLLSRGENIPLHEAQDRIARAEGYATWSALAARMAPPTSGSGLLPKLADGDMLLLGARPGHGKTLMGLQLLLDAARAGRRAVFFTLEYSDAEVIRRIRSLEHDAVRSTRPDLQHWDADNTWSDVAGGREMTHAPEIVTSGDISADFIVQHLSGSPCGTVAVIDYLQILDQQRSKPPLSEQLRVLREFARASGVILGFISQIDRSFDAERDDLPSLDNIRLPNPIPPDIFSKACFLHAGKTRFQHVC